MTPQVAARIDVAEMEHHDQGVAGFLAALTALSAEHGIGISGEPELFTMESEDYERSYHVNDASELIFE